MGLASWIATSFVVVLLARIVPFATVPKMLDAIVTVVTGVALGVAATALDFGGWREPDWRAITFVFFGSLAAAGAVRAILLWRQRASS